MKQPKSQPKANIALISVFLLGLVIFGSVFAVWNTAADIFFQPANSASTETVNFVVKENATTSDIAEELEKQGLIRNAWAFRIWARIKGLDTRLQAGVYTGLSPNMTINQITEILLNGQPDAATVLIVEGFRLEQIANALDGASDQMVNFKKDEFLEIVKNINNFKDRDKYDYLKSVPSGKSMEGMLFPDTYQFPIDSNAVDVVNTLAAHTQQIVTDNNLEELAKANEFESLYELFILASIVERETGSDEYRADIASVYWNRMYKPDQETFQLLGADPTVQYARDTENPPDEYWKPLDNLGREIAPDSPYNTYNVAGLPPTPICSPSLASLKATAEPKETNYYYFFADPKGETHFSATLAEHNAKIEEYGVSGQ